jgi:hypothetical protein
MTVTEAIENKVAGGGFSDPAWLSELDVLFAGLYFDALAGELSGGSCPECWKAMFSVRDQVKIARIQFALAGMNAHINHDLPMAIVSTCQATNTVPPARHAAVRRLHVSQSNARWSHRRGEEDAQRPLARRPAPGRLSPGRPSRHLGPRHLPGEGLGYDAEPLG